MSLNFSAFCSPRQVAFWWLPKALAGPSLLEGVLQFRGSYPRTSWIESVTVRNNLWILYKQNWKMFWNLSSVAPCTPWDNSHFIGGRNWLCDMSQSSHCDSIKEGSLLVTWHPLAISGQRYLNALSHWYLNFLQQNHSDWETYWRFFVTRSPKRYPLCHRATSCWRFL